MAHYAFGVYSNAQAIFLYLLVMYSQYILFTFYILELICSGMVLLFNGYSIALVSKGYVVGLNWQIFCQAPTLIRHHFSQNFRLMLVNKFMNGFNCFR